MVRQLCDNDASAKGCYRFLQNDWVSDQDILKKTMHNCLLACRNKYLVYIQDTTEINLYSHRGRTKKDNYVGTTTGLREHGLGFYIHPSLVLDAQNGTSYGFAHVKLWSRSGGFQSKKKRRYQSLPIEEKESYKWLEISDQMISALSEEVPGMVIVQDREGDIYEQFARIPKPTVDLLVRARSDRSLTDETKLFGGVAGSVLNGVVGAGQSRKSLKS